MFFDLSLPLDQPTPADLAADERMAVLSRQGHRGTHLDRLLGGPVPLEYCKSRGLLVEVSHFCQQREVRLADLPADHIQAEDFVFFRSGLVARYGYGSQEYLNAFFELSWELINFLLTRQVRFIGVDARGVRRNQEHHQADQTCEQARTYVIENLNLGDQPASLTPFRVYTAWFDHGGTGLPCRVVAEV